MTVKAIAGVAIRARSIEWSAPPKPGERAPESGLIGGRLELDPGPPPTALPAGLQAERDRLTADIRNGCPKVTGLVNLGIPAAWTLFRVIDLPSGSAEDLRGMVELQVDKFSPFPVEESTLSHEIVHEHEGRCRVILGAARTDLLNLLGESLRSAGIRPQWVDLNLLGWWQLLNDAGGVHATGAQVFLILDEQACDLILATGGVPVALRSLGGLDELPPEERDEELLRETLYTLSSMDFGRAAEPIQSVALWHRGEAPAALLARLREHFGSFVQAQALDTLPPLAEGLRRRAERRTAAMLNLAPAAWIQAESAARTRRHIIAAAGVIAGLWLTGMASLFGGLQWQKHQMAALDHELGILKAPAERVRAIRDRTQELHSYMDRSRSALECLREASDLLPPGMELKQFNYHKGKTLEISGEAEAYSLVADFKKELEKSDLFVNTELSRTHRTQQGKEIFKITATLPGGEKP